MTDLLMIFNVCAGLAVVVLCVLSFRSMSWRTKNCFRAAFGVLGIAALGAALLPLDPQFDAFTPLANVGVLFGVGALLALDRSRVGRQQFTRPLQQQAGFALLQLMTVLIVVALVLAAILVSRSAHAFEVDKAGRVITLTASEAAACKEARGCSVVTSLFMRDVAQLVQINRDLVAALSQAQQQAADAPACRPDAGGGRVRATLFWGPM
jgi:hypothetical protein